MCLLNDFEVNVIRHVFIMLPAGPQSPRSPSPSKMLQAPRASAEPESDVGAPSTYADSDLSDSDFPDDYGVIAGEEPAPESAADENSQTPLWNAKNNEFWFRSTKARKD
jgi:hypothetical protein